MLICLINIRCSSLERRYLKIFNVQTYRQIYWHEGDCLSVHLNDLLIHVIVWLTSTSAMLHHYPCFSFSSPCESSSTFIKTFSRKDIANLRVGATGFCIVAYPNPVTLCCAFDACVYYCGADSHKILQYSKCVCPCFTACGVEQPGWLLTPC